jgi:hypothetical protein
MKKPNPPRNRSGGFLLAVLLVLFPALPQTRLDLYDAQDNHLMFVMFTYDNNGKNTGRTVYMSDSTYVRTVSVQSDASGRRLAETSFDFNGDTVFSTAYGTSGETRSISIRDQFGLDQLGGAVSYRSSGTNDFIISQRGADIDKMSYEFDDEGNPSKITVSDPTGTLLYYGMFSEVGVVTPWSIVRSTIPRISVRGNNLLMTRFALTRSATVRCELVTLSGRRAVILFNGVFPQGVHQKNVRISSVSSLKNADGIYMIVLSIEGIIMARSRQLVARP